MEILWFDDGRDLAEAAADRVAALLAANPAAAIALPTGQTPFGLYRTLVRRCGEGRVSFAAARLFNLDEYLGLAADHPMSYARFLGEHLIGAIDARPGNVRLLDGAAADPEAECRAHDAAVAAAGGLDLAILGLGVNGHLAFNEPGDDWDAATHVVSLAPATIARHRAQTGVAAIPPRGLTMGLATLRRARAVMLLAAGGGKEAAMAALLGGRPDPAWPVTAILDHPDAVVLAEAGLAPGIRAGLRARPE